MLTFIQTVAILRKHYGAPSVPPAKGPFELILWENAVYLLPDERRQEVFEALRKQIGFTPAAIHAASDEILLPLAKRGGMRPETRVLRWRQIARITLDQYAGDLDSILSLPYTKAKSALKQFPTIGDPGAEKILLPCGVAHGLPLESNGLRVLVRLGWGRLQRDYGATYRSVQTALQEEIPTGAKALRDAHLLLRTHGKELCKDKAPLCHQCPLAAECSYAQSTAASFLRIEI